MQIKSITGKILFEYEGTLIQTLEDAVKKGISLYGADLRGANLDFSVLHFSCKSRQAKTDERLRIQLCYHLLSWIKYADNATEFEKELFEFAKEYANRFHRIDVEKFV